MIELDQEIPPFSATATSERTITNEDLIGKNTVIYFYPKDNTPGCTTEGQNFRDAKAELDELNTAVIGVSKDSIRVHEGFRNKHNFTFDLISDPEELFCKLFDVIKLKKLYGKEYMGIERSTFLIDAKGVLRKEWRKVKVKGHVDEVLASIKTM